MIVEDDEDNLLLAQNLVRLAGVEQCVGVRDAREAMSVLERLPRVDLVLLDLRLPEEDGYVMLERIRSASRLEDVKVVAVTVSILAEDVERARGAGFDGFLGKPLDFCFPGQLCRILAGGKVWEPG